VTIIAGYDDGATAALGSDTQVQTDHIKAPGRKKVYQVGRCLVGAAGCGLWYDFLREQSEAEVGLGLPDAWWGRPFCVWLAKSWLSWAKERGHGAMGAPSWYLDGTMLCATPGGLFVIDCMGSVRQCPGYHAIGSGAPVALGVLYARGGTPQERVRVAVQAAVLHAPGCGGDAVVREIDRRSES
jgi:ATP-dependent protease HslVU (ClpYQ) peptidase subunit